MKALFVSNDPKLFEEGSAVRERMRAYAKAIGELHVVSRAPRGSALVKEPGLTLYPITARKPFHFISLIRTTRAVIRAKHIEIVSVQDPFEHGLAARLAVMGTSVRLHLQLHTDAFSPYFAKGSIKNRIRLLIARATLPYADGIRVVSERVKASLVNRYGGRIVLPRVIPIALPSDIPNPVALPEHAFPFALIAVARLEPEKRIEDIFAALVIVKKKYPLVGLFIAGDGARRTALMNRARALGLESNVVFLGWRDDAWGLMQSAQALVEASAYEGYGLTLIEAALVRVPIVSTDVGIIGEVLKPETDALVAPVGNPGALAVRIMRLIEQNDLRTELALHAREAAAAHLAAFPDQPALIADDLARAARLTNTGLIHD